MRLPWEWLSGVLNSFESYAVDFHIFSLINGDDLNNLFKIPVFIDNSDFFLHGISFKVAFQIYTGFVAKSLAIPWIFLQFDELF